MTYGIPSHIKIESEFFGAEFAPEGQLVGTVTAVVTDSSGDMYCVFELPDTQGCHLIHLGSRFFRGIFSE